MTTPRWTWDPAGQRAYDAAQAAAAQVAADMAGNLHGAEVMASHPSQPTPAQHVASGATPPPGGAAAVATGTSSGSP